MNLVTYKGKCVDIVILIQATYDSLYPENSIILLFIHKKHAILNVSYTVWYTYVPWLEKKRWTKWLNISRMNYLWNMGNAGNMVDFTVLNVRMFRDMWWNTRDYKDSNENTHVHYLLNVLYANSNTSSIYPITKISKTIKLKV